MRRVEGDHRRGGAGGGGRECVLEMEFTETSASYFYKWVSLHLSSSSPLPSKGDYYLATSSLGAT